MLYNVFYEVFSVCTSIVAQTENGTLMHARSLDFGLLMGSVFVATTILQLSIMLCSCNRPRM